MPKHHLIEESLSRQIIGAFYDVYNDLGFGFLESVYRRAMAVELNYRGIAVAQEVPFELTHRGVQIGHYRADLIVDDRIVVEAKSSIKPDPFAPAQVLNYLKASRIEVGLVLHFGPKPSFTRVVASRPNSQSNGDANDADRAN